MRLISVQTDDQDQPDTQQDQPTPIKSKGFSLVPVTDDSQPAVTQTEKPQQAVNLTPSSDNSQAPTQSAPGQPSQGGGVADMVSGILNALGGLKTTKTYETGFYC